MMDTAASQTDASMRDGLGLDAFLVVGAVLAAVGWGGTQFLASSPGLALEVLGFEAAVVVVAYWLVASVGMVALALAAGQRVVRYSPLLWAWGALVSLALLVDVAVVLGAFGPSLGRTLLWTPWPVVIGVGFALTGLLAAHRARGAYLVGALAAGLVVLAAVLFPSTVGDWAFAATGVVHAVPLLVDARVGDRDTDAADDAASPYEFRELDRERAGDDAEEGGA
ncbi:hypothetical protein [Halorubellus salinus]|uniref:hypothetical protein n=1 Tax=Halorubellus salinus TaxID=755309 RepID=UPI001D08F48D|nr:hypothetical protein [Halorubellus salinus]